MWIYTVHDSWKAERHLYQYGPSNPREAAFGMDFWAFSRTVAGVSTTTSPSASSRREAVGRKNWLFVGSDDGAKWNPTFVSLIAGCQQHKLEPWA
jgi:hypothetical protein